MLAGFIWVMDKCEALMYDPFSLLNTTLCTKPNTIMPEIDEFSAEK